MNLFTGDEAGEILVAYGNEKTGFTLNFSHHEHACKIISIVVHGDWLLTSDACGCIVQYDMGKQKLLDKVSQPGLTGKQEVMLTQWMDGDFGVSAVKNQSSLYLYRIANVKTGHLLN